VTAPLPGTTGPPLSMCFTSCADYMAGWFTAYRRMAEDHPDLVLHLGDYIYEKGTGAVREPAPQWPTTTLADYRVRHAQYRTDPDLQAAHAVAPWVVVWDDHDVEDNYAGTTSKDPSERGFAQRRAAAYRAYWEHLPLRRSVLPTSSVWHLYRRIQWGRLATFHMLDTRQFRDPQACHGVASRCEAANDPTRSITGGHQERWLLDGLTASTTTWNLLGQQVFFAARDLRSGPGVRYSMDAWDGYTASRRRVLAGIVDGQATNPVVLTGDVHKNYANDVTLDPLVPGSPVVAAELVTTSISASGDGTDLPDAGRTQLAENPDIKFVNGQRGYVRTRIGHDLLTADFRVLPYVTAPDAPVSTRATFTVEAGRPGLQRA
jgi:alkaline phosphatase D